MTTIVRLTLALLATTAVLAACTKEIVTERTDTASVFGQADVPRVITVSFGSQTKTALGNDGLQPSFTAKDTVLVSNESALDTCEVTVEGNVATITTKLPGALTAVYPYTAAKMAEGDSNLIEDVIVPAVQTGKFADANICMAKMADENNKSLSFNNKTAVLRFYVDTCIGVTSIKVSATGDPIASNDAKEITVTAPEEGMLYGISGDPDRRICYVAVRPGNFTQLEFSSVTTSQTEYTDNTVSRQVANVALDTNKIYNAFIPYYIVVDEQKWGYCNVGAFLPEEPGDYFAWGEVSGHKYENNGWTNFPESNPDASRYPVSWDASKGFAECNTPYYDGSDYSGSKYSTAQKSTLELADDAAYANWGDLWRMPTEAEMEELTKSYIWNTAEKVYSFGSVPRMLIVPLTGYGDDSTLYASSYGVYWSSSLDSGKLNSKPENAIILSLKNPTANSASDIFEILTSSGDSDIEAIAFSRCYGCAIRPIYQGDIPE